MWQTQGAQRKLQNFSFNAMSWPNINFKISAMIQFRFQQFLLFCNITCTMYNVQSVHIQMSSPHQFTSSEVRRRQARQDNDRTWFQKRTKMIFIRLQRRAPPLRGKPRASWTLNVHLKCLHHYSCMRFYILSNLMAQLQQDSSKQVTSYFWT